MKTTMNYTYDYNMDYRKAQHYDKGLVSSYTFKIEQDID